MDTATATNTGKIVQVIGPVVDVDYSAASAGLPKIYDALEIEFDVIGKATKLTFEVQQHLGEGLVRAIAMSSTEVLKRGMRSTRPSVMRSIARLLRWSIRTPNPTCSKRGSRSST